MSARERGFALAAVGGAVACLVGEWRDLRWLVYVAKPATTLLLLAIAATARAPVSPRYRSGITAGLGASLAGDVFLMLPGDRFVAGLASFLVAHLCYIVAFWQHGGGWRAWRAAAMVACVAGGVLAALWPQLGALRVPVFAYVAVIATMAWQAAARAQRSPDAGAASALLGAVLFLVSDSALAFRRFMGGFAGATLVVLTTYWTAQWLIARSVERPARG